MKIKFQKYSLHSMQSFQGRFAQHSLFKYLGNCSVLIKIIFSTIMYFRGHIKTRTLKGVKGLSVTLHQ